MHSDSDSDFGKWSPPDQEAKLDKPHVDLGVAVCQQRKEGNAGDEGKHAVRVGNKKKAMLVSISDTREEDDGQAAAPEILHLELNGICSYSE